MKITSKNWKYHLDGEGGQVNVTPEDSDDIWALYNLIAEGDEVEAVTMRKVLQESSSGEVVDSQKVKMVLAVRVEKVDIDLASASLRVNGRNVKENRYVKLGSYHTLDVGPDRYVIIRKPSWDSLSIELLEQALASTGKVEIGAIVMQDGVALLCTVSPSGIKVLHRVEVSMPKKKIGPTSQLEKSMEKFFSLCIEGCLEHLRFASLKAIIIGGADYLRDDFYKKLIEHAQRNEFRPVLDNKAKFMRINVKNASPAALGEVLAEPRIASILADTKAAQEAKLIDAFFKMHNNDPDRTTYGVDHVLFAADQVAVKSLLISDSLFRSTNKEERKKFALVVENVKSNGGDVAVFSSGSAPEQELQKMTGIAAILNFPVDLE